MNDNGGTRGTARAPVPLLECAPDGLVVWANDEAQVWLEGASHLAQAFDLEDRHRVQAHLEHAWTTEAWSRTHLWIGTLQLTSARSDCGVCVAVTDVAELALLVDELRSRARSDPLTGLGNRTVLLDHLQRALSGMERTDEPIALLFCDLDDFKAVNDTWGHAIGDEVLIQFARHLERSVRPRDIVCRVGGDEFVVLLESTPLLTASAIADRIVDVRDRAISTSASEAVAISVSVGIAVESGPIPADDLLGRADTAMYVAKAQGRSQRIVYGSDLEDWISSPHDERSSLLAAHLALRNRYEELVRTAQIDSRTGLLDDRQFERDLADIHQPGRRYAVLFADIDHFHDYNDRYSHLVGHEALAQVGAILRTTIGDTGKAYRYGGEEFTVLLPGVECIVAATAIGEQIRSAVEAAGILHAGGIGDVVTVSVGVALADGAEPDRTSGVRAADLAMLQAKRLGRNRVGADPVRPADRA